MGLKQLLTAVALCASATLAWAQGATYGLGAIETKPADSVYYEVDLDQLVAAVRNSGLRFSTEASSKASQDAQLLTILRYRLLMGLLSQPNSAPAQSPVQIELKGQNASADTRGQGNTQGLERRIARLEQAVQSLLLNRVRPEDRQLFLLNSQQKQASAPGSVGVSQRNRKRTKSTQTKATSTIVDTVRVQVVDTIKVMPAVRIEPIAQPLVSQATTLVPAGQTRVDTLRIVELRQDTVVVREAGALERAVFFPVGASRITAETKLTLGSVLEYLQHYPAERVRLTGYASPEGSLEANMRLAKARTEAVRLYLISMGIAEDRLEVVQGGLGSSSISPQLDRRVQIESIR